ncbi:hypothetical protein [Teredinibacter sp. KSP-S5-2]|uniref:hypothetical protein n=1 Tax=Teredinibacter sp. KSP-S5-2 TaxID=3034506 RepID=UPI002934AB96|nr:hypothetical protein [Teredinibacter sp. KSP-S5-2]WNO08878.1 hypothetical protein P5V12_18060 [Teredinibacter sp. KSP-S5-2]
MNKIEAREIVSQQVIEKYEGFSLMDESTQEFATCFAFYYQNDQYIKSRNILEMSVGAGPILVCKKSGAVFETGSAHSAEHYVKAFESCGDPFGELTEHILVFGWKEGADKVAATKLIKAKSGLNLRDSKIIIDKALKYEESRFSTENSEESAFVSEELSRLGFECKQLWSNQC